MATNSEKRQRIEKLVLDVVRKLETKKTNNYDRISAMFKMMSDEDFDKWANECGTDLDKTIQLYFLPFEEPSLDDIKNAADVLGIPLEEYVWYRHTDPNGVRTKERVPVGYIPIRRTQQLLSKKQKYSLDTSDISIKTGQVKGESKVAAISDTEAFALSSISADMALKELFGPRSDNLATKNQMYQKIAVDGYFSMNETEDDISKHASLNTLNTYLLASGLRSDLVTNTLETVFTIKNDIKRS